MEEYTVEYYEEHSEKSRAINVSCDSPHYADIAAMKAGAKVLRVHKVYRFLFKKTYGFSRRMN